MNIPNSIVFEKGARVRLPIKSRARRNLLQSAAAKALILAVQSLIGTSLSLLRPHDRLVLLFQAGFPFGRLLA
jgi:hypothetical protein